MEGFIVGGYYADSINEFPHVAFLSLHTANNDTLLCGSSVLNQMILITAAHCLMNIVEVNAFVGNLDRKKGRLYRVVNVAKHKKWNSARVINDIGLCKLEKPLSFGKAVKRVVLLKRPPKARDADVAGWGLIDESHATGTVILKHTKQKLWNLKQCREVVANAPNGTVCGGERHAEENFVSSGDSGSGLLVNKHILVGLVSYKDVSISQSLVVYTDVTYFHGWIVKESRRLACP